MNSVLQRIHCVRSTRKNRKVDLIAISDLVSIHKVGRVVIGITHFIRWFHRSTSGKRFRSLQKRLAQVIDVPIQFQDERFTTAEAEEILRNLNKDVEEQKELIDEVAAVIILTDYLNQNREPESTTSAGK